MYSDFISNYQPLKAKFVKFFLEFPLGNPKFTPDSYANGTIVK